MIKKETLVVSLYAGPGSGKSTSMAGIFAELKLAGVNAEMAPEFAKEKVWEKSFNVLGNQIYVFGKQLHTLVRVAGQVDVVVTDSPLLLSLIYGKNELQEFKQLVLAVNGQFRMLNFFLQRKKKYNPSGRMQTEPEARDIDCQILNLLDDNNIQYEVIESGREGIQTIAKKVLDILGHSK